MNSRISSSNIPLQENKRISDPFKKKTTLNLLFLSGELDLLLILFKCSMMITTSLEIPRMEKYRLFQTRTTQLWNNLSSTKDLLMKK
jgi:hypothetical protein